MLSEIKTRYLKVAQSCLTFCHPMDIQSMEFSKAEYWSGQPFPFPGDLSNPEIEPRHPTLQVDYLSTEPPGNPKNTGVGSLYLSPRDPNPGIKPRSSALQVYSLPAEPLGKPKNTGDSRLSLLQQIFLTQESNHGLCHCRQILYQLFPYKFAAEIS